ncbi:MAG TPA: hypothetical protein VJB35_06165 [Candidatus Nanoarchaeia archaeon]|nr:hypothetical protein [Candidatus Nanoarchaeia archaeon]
MDIIKQLQTEIHYAQVRKMSLEKQAQELGRSIGALTREIIYRTI